MDAITVRNLTFSYPNQSQPALEHVDLTVPSGAFAVLCGQSGSGKTTLLRLLKPALAPHGVCSGTILFHGEPLEGLDARAGSARIGFVRQSPDDQIVTDRVWHELAFGLESLGYDTPAIRRRVAEMASFFGMEDWFSRETSSLSGGQKQLLNLAAVMVMRPEVLLLDEPTSQLDPIAATEFLNTLARLNRELGTTILLSEHRLEEALPLASMAAVLEGGRVLCAGTPSQVGAALRTEGHAMFYAMPTAMRVWAAADGETDCPVSVREGRDWLEGLAARRPLRELPPEPVRSPGEAALTAEELWFRYEKDAPDIVRGLSLTVRQGELVALLGGNGAGKTTALALLCGLKTPQRGYVWRRGSVALLPQEPQTLFTEKALREELLSALPEGERLDGVVRLCGLQTLLERHPYDLSGGEQQRAALAKLLLRAPDVLLLDEPTKGMDAAFKLELAEILNALLGQGKAIFMVSHDLEFCAACAHRCALLFQGSVVTEGTPREFFSGNSFYTTAANRMARERLPEAVTPEDVILACGGEAEPPPPRTRPDPASTSSTPQTAGARRPRRSPWAAAAFLAAALIPLTGFLRSVRFSDLSGLERVSELDPGQLLRYGALILCLLLAAVCATGTKSRRALPPARRKPSKRAMAATGLLLLLFPVTLLLGELLLQGRKYYFISLLALVECMALFLLRFEGRKPQARELALIAALCAMGVAGRTAFFMLPQFKPVLALTILAGAAFGGETGFLVGAATMLVSNMMFSQGPWTPWQMFAMGIIGFLAGLLCDLGLLRRARVPLCIFGALSAILLYGGIMNLAAALIWTADLNREILLSYYVTGFPMDCVHAAATWIFLWIGAEPMLEKLERVKQKYGLMEPES